ncbi:MAG: TolC family protein [Bacteroidales bacterium]|nr:TolC family protein [Bacteroidales bacterium]
MKIKTLTILMFLVASTALAGGQDSTLTINEAVEFAYSNNTELQQLMSQLDQQREGWRTETGIAPTEISYFREGVQTAIPENIFDEQRITISQEIDFPLTTLYRLKALKQKVFAFEYRINALERKIKSEVKMKYIDVMYALYLQRSRQEQLRIADELYNAVYAKVETGMANGVDLINAELQSDEAANALDEAEWILHEARYGLFYSMGLPAEEQQYSIAFSDTLRTNDVGITQIQSIELQEDQPEYMAIDHELTAADYYIKEAKSNILPDIGIRLYKQDYGDGFNHRGFEVGLSIPLWYPFEQKGRISMAKAEKEKLGWQQAGVKLEMKKNIEYAWHNYSVSRRIMERYNETMTSRAGRLRSMALRAYQLGELDLLELLNAQQTYINSQQSFLSALRNYYLQLAAMEKYFNTDLVY